MCVLLIKYQYPLKIVFLSFVHIVLTNFYMAFIKVNVCQSSRFLYFQQQITLLAQTMASTVASTTYTSLKLGTHVTLLQKKRIETICAFACAYLCARPS